MQEENQRCDPLVNIPFYCLDNIFQHFEARDVKAASLVSKTWYKNIGYSRVCMGKLLLHLQKLETLEPLQGFGNHRRYVYSVWNDETDECNMRRSHYLKDIADDLLELEVKNIHDSIKLEEISFNKLKKLEISWDASWGETLDKAMSMDANSLSHLRISAVNKNADCLNSVLKFIQKQENLKHLKLSGSSQLVIGLDTFKVPNLRLKSLEISHLSWEMLQVAPMQQNVFTFLDLQSPTLQHLTISTTCHETLQKVLTLPIKSLKITFFSFVPIDHLQINETIEVAEIGAFVVNTQFIIQHLSKLKQLFIKNLFSGILQAVVESAPNLEKIFFVYFSVVDPHHEKSKKEAVDRNIQLVPVDYKFKFVV